MQLMLHQAKAVEFLHKNKGIGAFFHEVGCGKTISALASFLFFKEQNPKLHLFILCPLSLIEGAWIKEIEKFAPHLNWYDLHSKRGHVAAGRKDFKPDIYITNFEHLVSEKKFLALRDQLLHTHSGFDWMCVIDESSKMKNHAAQTTKRILALRDYFLYRVIMSGTPAPNIEWEYWAQMCFLNPAILGDNFFKFKNIYFEMMRGRQIAPGAFMTKKALQELFKQGFKYQVNAKKRPQMLERMKPWCDTVAARDCMDLPDEIDEYRIMEMTEAHKEWYNRMKNEYVLELKETDSLAVANVALTKLMKLRQITSGFVIDENGRAVGLHVEPKLDALMDIVEECGNNQMIIWGQFHYEIELIASHLNAIGGVSLLYGKTPQHERINHVNDFISGKNRFLIAHPDSAAHGLTFTNCHIQVFYSMSYSFEEYSQARGRTMRYGQKNNCVYFHLLCKKSIDEDVLAIVQRKSTAADIAEKYLKG